MNILEELYYGNINISERDVKEGSDEQAAAFILILFQLIYLRVCF